MLGGTLSLHEKGSSVSATFAGMVSNTGVQAVWKPPLFSNTYSYSLFWLNILCETRCLSVQKCMLHWLTPQIYQSCLQVLAERYTQALTHSLLMYTHKTYFSHCWMFRGRAQRRACAHTHLGTCASMHMLMNTRADADVPSSVKDIKLCVIMSRCRRMSKNSQVVSLRAVIALWRSPQINQTRYFPGLSEACRAKMVNLAMLLTHVKLRRGQNVCAPPLNPTPHECLAKDTYPGSCKHIYEENATMCKPKLGKRANMPTHAKVHGSVHAPGSICTPLYLNRC